MTTSGWNSRRPVRRRVLVSFLAVLVLCWMAIPDPAFAAHSRRRPVLPRRVSTEPRYDRSITTFSSEGRLQQVEYGMEAARRGDTVAALATPDLVAFAVTSSSSTSSSLHDCRTHHHYHNNKVHRIDHHVLLVTTGLVGDGRALASSLRASCQQFRLSYGEPPTVSEVADMAAKMQHDLTRTGGARPLGCSVMVVGVDPDQGRPRLFQTEPGGIVEECQYTASGRGRQEAMESLGKDSVDLMRPKPQHDDNDPEDSDQQIDHVTRATRAVAMAVIGSLEIDDNTAQTVDGWIVRADDSRRGGVSLTCYRNLSREIVASLTTSIN